MVMRRGATTAGGTRRIGQRLAEIRKQRGLTQQELAERLGISQPIVSDYERGALRLHGELILKLSDILSVSADVLLGIDQPEKTPAFGNRRLLRRLRRVDRLSKRDQEALLRTIDAFLAKAPD